MVHNLSPMPTPRILLVDDEPIAVVFYERSWRPSEMLKLSVRRRTRMVKKLEAT